MIERNNAEHPITFTLMRGKAPRNEAPIAAGPLVENLQPPVRDASFVLERLTWQVQHPLSETRMPLMDKEGNAETRQMIVMRKAKTYADDWDKTVEQIMKEKAASTRKRRPKLRIISSTEPADIVA